MRLALIILWGMVAASPVGAATFTEDFSGPPAANGWNVFGDATLFNWNSANQNLEVTWDSTQTNSYFYHPLGTVLTSNDSFTVEFDLQLSNAVISASGFEVAVGLFNFADATRTNFYRGSGHDSPNLFEFDFFPDFGFGPSMDATLTDRNSRFRFVYDNLPFNFGVVHHIVLHHIAGTLFISGEVYRDGLLYTALPIVFNQPPLTNFTDFRLDTVSVSSYDDARSTGSILAHGVVDNFVLTLPPLPIQNLTGTFSNGVWQVEFLSASNWLYTLERTVDLHAWTNASPATSGSGTNLVLPDMISPVDNAFYRVRANRP